MEARIEHGEHLRGLARGQHEGGVLGGLANDGGGGVAGVAELPAPLEGVDVHRGRAHRLRGDLVLLHHGGPEEPGHHDRGDHGVDDLEGQVVLRLLGNGITLSSVTNDRPQNESGSETTDDGSGHREALPEMERRLCSLRYSLFGIKAGNSATGEEESRSGNRQYAG